MIIKVKLLAEILIIMCFVFSGCVLREQNKPFDISTTESQECTATVELPTETEYEIQHGADLEEIKPTISKEPTEIEIHSEPVETTITNHETITDGDIVPIENELPAADSL